MSGDRPHLVGPLEVAGHEVLVRTNSDEFAQAAALVFADLTMAQQARPPEAAVRFDVTCHGEPVRHWSVHRDGEPCELQLRPDAALVYLQWELNRLVIESNRCAVHAAAVVVDGGGVLLAGTSHSGKTTLAGWLAARHGAGFVCDEVAAVDERLKVLTYPRPLGVRAGGPLAGAAPEDDIAAGLLGNERLVPISTLGGRCAGPAPMWAIVFPTFEPGAALTIGAVGPGDALARLCDLTPGIRDHGGEVFERLSALVGAAPALAVRYGHVEHAARTVTAAVSTI